MVSKHRRTRLVVCVDGTWTNPDGIEFNSKNNLTNVYRIFSAVQEGKVLVDKEEVVQKKQYWPGPGTESNTIVKTAAGIWGYGCERLIKDVYEYCCDKSAHDDHRNVEIFFFGFSRGAYIVRAVAGLLHNMRAIRSEDNNFDKDYRDGLSIYTKLCSAETRTERGALDHFITSKTRPAPTVRFVGLFDTVKAVKPGPHIHDTSVTDTGLCYRQALALNEERSNFKHEILQPKGALAAYTEKPMGSQYIDAWFIGAHADMGGGNEFDGLSLYPLQWILSEAVIHGLRLGSDEHLQSQHSLEDITRIIFPTGGDDVSGAYGEVVAKPYRKDPFRAKNGVQSEFWDIRRCHSTPSYMPQINLSVICVAGLSWTVMPRNIFENGQLIGYRANVPYGTMIHPSVYLISDTVSHIHDFRYQWPFCKDLLDFRKIAIPYKNSQFWEAETDGLNTKLPILRILVCGNNGIGKSTLINNVFAIKDPEQHVTQVHAKEHGQHNVRTELKHSNKPDLIIHDSRGFQARGQESHSSDSSPDANPNEVELVRNFLKERLQTTDWKKRLNIIWYCVKIDKERLTDVVDEQLFDVIRRTDSHVPVVLVITKTDKLRREVRQDVEEQLEAEAKRQANSTRTEGSDSEDDIDNKQRKLIRKKAKEAAEKAVIARSGEFMTKFKEYSYKGLIGPVCVSEKENDSFAGLITVTKNKLPSILHDMLVSHQICNVDAKMELAIDNAVYYAKCVTRTAAIPAGADISLITKATTGPLLAKHIQRAFGFDVYNADVIWTIVADCLWRDLPAQAAYGASLLATITAVAYFSPAMPVVIALGSAHAALNVPRSARMFLMIAADLILMFERAHWFHYHTGNGEDGCITEQDVRLASKDYQDKMSAVHAMIAERIPLHSVVEILWNPESLRGVLRTVLNKHRHEGKKVVIR